MRCLISRSPPWWAFPSWMMRLSGDFRSRSGSPPARLRGVRRNAISRRRRPNPSRLRLQLLRRAHGLGRIGHALRPIRCKASRFSMMERALARFLQRGFGGMCPPFLQIHLERGIVASNAKRCERREAPPQTKPSSVSLYLTSTELL